MAAACNRSPGSKLLSITTQLHCGGHLGGRARLPNTILEEDHPMTIPKYQEKNVETVMVNNSTNINKTKHLLSLQLIKTNKKTMTYNVGNPGADFG
jgi:hypothetical protein